MNDRNIYSGLVRLHILYYAGKQPVSGNWIRSGLEKRGYYLSGSTLYPILLDLEKQNYLVLQEDQSEKNTTKLYRTTEKGDRAFIEAKLKIRELFGELFEETNEQSD